MKNAVICFTRVPRPGKTKTRLMPHLTGDQCAQLHWAFLEDLAGIYRELDADLFVAHTADAKWASLKAVFPTARFFLQEGSGLGEKMDHALNTVLSLGYEKVVLTGSDLPLMSTDHLRSGFDALENADIALDFSILGQGEYNLNYTFRHPVTGNTLMLRINRGSQMHLNDQIGYEFSALHHLAPSGRTPKAICCWPDMKCLVMEHLPGRALRYETDLAIGAEILADIHAVEIPADCRLLEPANPLEAIIDECRQMVQHYYTWTDADPRVVRLLETLEKEISAKDLSAPAGIRKCIVNTEVNSGNFLINPGQSYLVDWEKPVISEPAQDLGHFLVPTTTFWKTDVILKPEEIRHFVRCYETAVAGRFDTASLAQRLPLYFTVTCLRGVTWCAMAYREYCQPGRDLRNADTFEKLKAYLQPDFLENLLKNYVRKDFLA